MMARNPDQPRVLLIFPPSLYRNHTPPLNLAYVAAVLEQEGCHVSILDASGLHSAMDSQQVLARAREFQPDLIGLTLNMIFIQPAYELIRTLKSLEVPIMVGGPHPSLLDREALEHGCDLVVRGEGEETTRELVGWLRGERSLEEIHGLSFLRDGQMVRTPERCLVGDLDDLPYPAKHLFDRSAYVADSPDYQAFGPILSGRGCPAKCTYCYKGVFGDGARVRRAEAVFEEMRFLHREHGVTAFEFLDDAFSLDLERVDRLCEMILQEPDFRIRWQCTTRLDFTSRDLLEKMARSGCFRVFYGFESGDRDTLRRIRKKLDVQQAIRTLKWTRQAGIRSIVGFMFGFPWESPEQVRATVRVIRTIRPLVDEINPLGILVPVPGTELYEEYKEKFGLEEWWLSERYGARYRSNTYYPYFRRRFYNDFALLEDGFFPFPAGVRREILKGTRTIGLHNTLQGNRLPKAAVILAMVALSRGLYGAHPRLEGAVFGALGAIRGLLRSRGLRWRRVD